YSRENRLAGSSQECDKTKGKRVNIPEQQLGKNAKDQRSCGKGQKHSFFPQAEVNELLRSRLAAHMQRAEEHALYRPQVVSCAQGKSQCGDYSQTEVNHFRSKRTKEHHDFRDESREARESKRSKECDEHDSKIDRHDPGQAGIVFNHAITSAVV